MRSPRPLAPALALGAALAAAAFVALAEPPKGGFPPDPPGHASKKQWTIEVTATSGKVSAERATAANSDKPVETARVFGRFAFELWIGRELLDRVRFNVPLMGDDPPQGNRNKLPRPRFDQGVTAKVSTRIADHPRAAYAQLVDRETGDIQKLEWPPGPDGKLRAWKNEVTEAKPGDFPDGGIRAVGARDAGADAAPSADAGPSDAGRD